MRIKNLFIFLTLCLNLNVYSQTYTSLYDKVMNGRSASKGSNIIAFNMTCDFDNDGINEIFKGVMLKRINDDTYWIKNSQIINNKNEVILEFGEKLTVNGRDILEQGVAVNGYIVEISKINNKNELLVSIANDRGEKSSDELLINIKDIR